MRTTNEIHYSSGCGELLVDFRTHRRDPHRFEIAGIEFMDVVMGRRITDSHLRVVHIKQD